MWWLFMIVLCEAGKHARCLNALKKCTSAVEGWRMLLTKMQQWTKHGKGSEISKTVLCFGVDRPPCCVFLVFKLSSFAAFYFYKQMKKHHSLPNYRIAQNFDGGKFWCFWRFPARPTKFNPSNWKTTQHLQAYGERQWPSITIFSVKYLKSRYLSKFPPVNILRYTVHLWINWCTALASD